MTARARQISKYSRGMRGISLIEMLSTIFIMSFAAAAITEVCVTQNVVAFRTFNKIESLTNSRRVASVMERDVHNARFIGDQFGSNQNTFPGGGSDNPYLISGPSATSGITNFLGFPGSTNQSVWPSPAYMLNGQTLILQIPVFTLDGFPTKANTPGQTYWNVDTYVYKILADTANAGTGQFLMQKTCFPGVHIPGTDQPAPPIASNTPQTILTGIVGPVDLTASADPVAGTPPPKVFQFLTKQYPIFYANSATIAQSFISAPQTSDPLNINGVALTLEVFSDANSKRPDFVPKTLAFRQEFYLRGNASSP